MSRTQKQETDRPPKTPRKQRMQQALRAQNHQRSLPDLPLPEPPRWSPMG
jgi:hypothetical protein